MLCGSVCGLLQHPNGLTSWNEANLTLGLLKFEKVIEKIEFLISNFFFNLQIKKWSLSIHPDKFRYKLVYIWYMLCIHVSSDHNARSPTMPTSCDFIMTFYLKYRSRQNTCIIIMTSLKLIGSKNATTLNLDNKIWIWTRNIFKSKQLKNKMNTTFLGTTQVRGNRRNYR